MANSTILIRNRRVTYTEEVVEAFEQSMKAIDEGKTVKQNGYYID